MRSFCVPSRSCQLPRTRLPSSRTRRPALPGGLLVDPLIPGHEVLTNWSKLEFCIFGGKELSAGFLPPHTLRLSSGAARDPAPA